MRDTEKEQSGHWTNSLQTAHTARTGVLCSTILYTTRLIYVKAKGLTFGGKGSSSVDWYAAGGGMMARAMPPAFMELTAMDNPLITCRHEQPAQHSMNNRYKKEAGSTGPLEEPTT